MGILHTMKEKMFGRLQRNVAESSDHIGELKSTFSNRLAGFREHRTAADQKVVTEDFGNLLDAWGIQDEREIPEVCTELRWRYPLFALPVITTTCLALWQQTMISWVIAVCCGIPCLFGLVTTMWRIAILQGRKFIPFTRWLCLPLRPYGAGVCLSFCLVTACSYMLAGFQF